MRSGICLVHKPVGPSSFGMVKAFTAEAREAGLKKFPLGHGGTLDPFASGLLLVLAGQATRLMELMHPLPKTYLADLAWGTETDTGDHLGVTVSEGDASGLTVRALDAALAPFHGWLDQVPPATSAKKIGGESAYKKAHRGEAVELPSSKVYLHSARWLAHDLPRRSTLELTVKGGFYVRSLARDLGQALGCGAHLASLRRTAIGPWTDPGEGNRVWLEGDALIPWCASRRLDDAELDHLLHGRPIPPGSAEPAGWPFPGGFPVPETPLRGLHGDRLVALLKEREGFLWTTANLRGGL